LDGRIHCRAFWIAGHVRVELDGSHPIIPIISNEDVGKYAHTRNVSGSYQGAKTRPTHAVPIVRYLQDVENNG
jgi:hypothetical protein